jgi:hypothetical protein
MQTTNQQQLNAARLSPIFVGKKVTVTHTGNLSARDSSGICSAFHDTENGSVDIELQSSQRFGFIPDVLTDDSVEGPIGSFIEGRRKIKLGSPDVFAEKITLSVERSLGPNVNDGPFIVMRVDNKPYIMLTVKKNILAAKLAETIPQEFGIKKVIVGMAFNARASVQEGMLVVYSDPTINGIYIPFSDFHGDIRNGSW